MRMKHGGIQAMAAKPIYVFNFYIYISVIHVFLKKAWFPAI